MPENEEMDSELDEGSEEEGSKEETAPESTLREIEKDEDEDELPVPKKSNKIFIAVLSLVIFLALFVFFKGEEEPGIENSTDIQPPLIAESTAPTSEEEIFGDIVVEPEFNMGKIVIAGEETETKPEVEEVIVPIPKEELPFFDPLSDIESEHVASESEAMALVKAEIPKIAHAFTIQLGAFKDRTGADKLDDRLRSRGYDSFVLAVPNEVYRVRVGSFKSREAAKRVAAKLKKMEQLDSFITME